MNSTKIFWGLVFCLLILGSPVWAQLSYEGSSSIGGSMLPELAKAFEKKSGTAFGSIVSNDSDQAVKAVTSGKAVIGGLSRLMTPEELKEDVANRVIGYDAIVVYVNKENPIQNLTSDQVRRIFLNEVTNWKDLGGIDAPIVTVLKESGDLGGTTKQFRELLLEGKDLATPAFRFTTHKADVEFVASNPTAITFASLAFDDKTCRFISIDSITPSRETLNRGEYPLARPYVFVYLNKNAEDKAVSGFMDFVFSQEGQAIVKSYVVPVMGFEEKPAEVQK